MLVADPKQAIYAFRGADVYAYLVAAATADERATLLVNRRSDQPLLDAFDALFDDARLGHEDIVYRQVRAAPAHQTTRLRGAPDERRAAGPGRAPRPSRRSSRPTTGTPGRPRPARTSPAISPPTSCGCSPRARGSSTATPTASRPARSRSARGTSPCWSAPTRTPTWSASSCTPRACPAVINGGGNVFATATARDWLRLLEALERPASTIRARTAAATPFLGWSGERIATAAEPEWEEVAPPPSPLEPDPPGQRRRRADRGDHGRRGPRRADARETGGERRLTDLDHIAQLLHRAATRRAARRHRAARLAGRADRRRGARGRRGRADPAARVRRRGGAGAHDPPQQGPRVPDRVLPVPVGGELHLARRRAGVLPRSGRRVPADDRRRAGRARLERPRAPPSRRAAGRGSAARLRRADPREAPGGDLVGGVLRQPQLAARAAAVRRRIADGNVAPGRPLDADRRRRRRALRASSPRQAQGAIGVERSTLERPTTWSPPIEPPVDLAAARFDRRSRRLVAAHLLQRHHRRGARPASSRASPSGAS